MKGCSVMCSILYFCLLPFYFMACWRHTSENAHLVIGACLKSQDQTSQLQNSWQETTDLQARKATILMKAYNHTHTHTHLWNSICQIWIETYLLLKFKWCLTQGVIEVQIPLRLLEDNVWSSPSCGHLLWHFPYSGLCILCGESKRNTGICPGVSNSALRNAEFCRL